MDNQENEQSRKWTIKKMDNQEQENIHRRNTNNKDHKTDSRKKNYEDNHHRNMDD